MVLWLLHRATWGSGIITLLSLFSWGKQRHNHSPLKAEDFRILDFTCSQKELINVLLIRQKYLLNPIKIKLQLKKDKL